MPAGELEAWLANKETTTVLRPRADPTMPIPISEPADFGRAQASA
jgi:hypothetical protein